MYNDPLPLLTLQYHASGHRDMGRPKQKWKDQWRLQDYEERALMDINRNSS